MVTIYWDIKTGKCYKYMFAKNNVENFNSCLCWEI